MKNFSSINNYFIELSIKTIKDENIKKDVRAGVADSLTKLARSSDSVLDSLIEIIKDDNIDYLLRIKVAEALTNLDINNDKIINILIENIKEYKHLKHLYFKHDKIVKFLINSSRSDDEIINIIIEFLKAKYLSSEAKENIAANTGE